MPRNPDRETNLSEKDIQNYLAKEAGKIWRAINNPQNVLSILRRVQPYPPDPGVLLFEAVPLELLELLQKMPDRKTSISEAVFLKLEPLPPTNRWSINGLVELTVDLVSSKIRPDEVKAAFGEELPLWTWYPKGKKDKKIMVTGIRGLDEESFIRSFAHLEALPSIQKQLNEINLGKGLIL